MNVSAPANASIALAHARKGRPVVPGCPPNEHGACHCGGYRDQTTHELVPHSPKAVGKAPIGRLVKGGIDDATTNSATIDRWWRSMPDANVNAELQASGWVVVDTDSAQVEADALSRGLDGGVIRESRNRAYVFTRPADCPVINLIRSEGDPLDVLALGNFVVHGTHQTGCPVRMDPEAQPGPAPAWVVDLLKRKAAEKAAQEAATAARRAERATQYGVGGEPPVRLHRRGQERWSGELVSMTKDGKIDRDLSLFYLGLDLAECNASESAIVAALEERDETLGWRKFTGRSDAEKRYTEIAEKAVARAIERENAPEIQFSAPAPDATIAELRAVIDDQAATITRLQRGLLDRDDRLEVLEDIVHSIDDVLNRPNEEMSAGDKVVLIGTARWLPFYRSKQIARGKPPTIALGYVAKVVGMSKSTVSSTFKRFSSKDPEDGAPFRSHVTRVANDDPDGPPFISTLEIEPWGERPSQTLRAAVSYAQIKTRPKHGGSKEASDKRWGRCSVEEHDNDLVRVKGYCPDCGEVVGERIVTIAEFDALNEQVGHSEPPEPTVSNANLIGKQVAHSAHQPTNLFDYSASRPKPWRCACGSLERYPLNPHPGAPWRCEGCGSQSRVAAVAGGEE